MPRYHSLATSIKLGVWDPAAIPPNAEAKLNDSEACANPQNQPLTTRLEELRPKKTNLHFHGPAAGYLVEDLKEEYFDGEEGVNFLGGCMPFFLVRAGRDLLGIPQALQKPYYGQRSSGPSDDSNLTNLSLTLRNGTSLETPPSDPDTDSFLSSISSSRFSSPSLKMTRKSDAACESRHPFSNKAIAKFICMRSEDKDD